MVDQLTPGTAIFVGGFVAALFWFAALLTYVAGSGVSEVQGLAVGLGALGGVFLAIGVVVAVALTVLEG
ncbi:MAG: hypothetical protein ACQETI_01255 [Halobacteriota archaeon]